MTAGRAHAERFAGLGKPMQWCIQCESRVSGPCGSRLCKAVDPRRFVHANAPAPFIGNGPCAPRCFPMPGHRTQAEIMAAEARGSC